MVAYEQVLEAMECLLDGVGEEHWRDSIREDISRWHASGDVSRHLSQHAGMGSFNDVVLSELNGHTFAPGARPWANAAIATLRAMCYLTAHEPRRRWAGADLRRDLASVGHSSEGFVLDPAPPEHRDERTLLLDRGAIATLGAVQCLSCGHAVATDGGVDEYIARIRVPEILLTACEEGDLVPAVQRILNVRVPALDQQRDEVRAALSACGVVVSRREHPGQRCSTCGSDDLAFSRWRRSGRPPWAFSSDPDNLPPRCEAPPEDGNT